MRSSSASRLSKIGVLLCNRFFKVAVKAGNSVEAKDELTDLWSGNAIGAKKDKEGCKSGYSKLRLVPTLEVRSQNRGLTLSHVIVALHECFDIVLETFLQRPSRSF